MKELFKKRNLGIIYCKTEDLKSVLKDGECEMRAHTNDGDLGWYSSKWEVWIVPLLSIGSLLIPTESGH